MAQKFNLPKAISIQEAKLAKIPNYSLEQELKECVVEYANSVNTTRALPDARDGLKPGQRRVLFMMYKMGLLPTASYVKNARITGQVMGVLHPHGSSYGSLARMGASYASRYLAVDFQGNVGSTDGDNPAAERYTEGRLAPYAMALLQGINKDTVDFVPNYDEKDEEPTVLPARLPNLLLNGCSGMGVSIASDILPHNLVEVLDAIIFILRARISCEVATLDQILAFIKGPDFPSGAELLDTSEIRHVYETGKGSITVQAKYKLEKTSKGVEKIVFIEMPYMLDKLKLQSKIEQLVKDGKLDGVASVADLSSDKNGIRFEVEVKKGYSSQIVINNLYKQTPLRQRFNSNMMVVVGGVPRLMNLEQLLTVYIEHQLDVLRRSHQFDLNKTVKRFDIVQALLSAHANKSNVIQIISNAESEALLIQELKSALCISDEGAEAVAEIKLRKLNIIEESKLKTELQELNDLRNQLQGVISDENKLIEVLISDLEGFKKTLGDKRRTKLVQPSVVVVETKDLVENTDCAVTLTKLGYIRRVPLEEYTKTKRAFKSSSKLQDAVVKVITAKTLDTLLFITSKGYAVPIKAHLIDEVSKNAKGQHVASLLKLPSTEQVVGAVNWPDGEYAENRQGILIVTHQGFVKRIDIKLLQELPKKGAAIIGLGEGDSVISMSKIIGSEFIYMLSQKGFGIRWDVAKLRSVKSKSARGVVGIRLVEDNLVAAESLSKDIPILVLTSNCFYKLLPQEEFKLQGRGGKGLITLKSDIQLGQIVSAHQVASSVQVLILLDDGTILPRAASEFELLERKNKAKNFYKEGQAIGAAII